MKFRQTLFWDTDPKTIDVRKNAPYIIERVLDFGRDSEVNQLWHMYSKRMLRKVVSQSRSLRPRTKALWELILQK